MNRVLLPAALTFGLLAGDTAATTPDSSVDMKAAAARRALAHRYDSCEVASVVDRHIVKKRLELSRPQGRSDQIDVTFAVRQNPAATYYEKAYADDDTVTWYPVEPMGRVPIPGRRGQSSYGRYIPGPQIAESQGDATSFTLPLYPVDTYQEGDRFGVFLTEVAETTDLAHLRQFSAAGVKFCGMVTLKATGHGLSWQVDRQASPMDSYYDERECPVMPDPSQPGVFSSSC